jgi:hypothetical protein
MLGFRQYVTARLSFPIVNWSFFPSGIWRATSFWVLIFLAIQSYAADIQDGFYLKSQYYQDRNDSWCLTGAVKFIKTLPANLWVKWDHNYDAVSGASRSLGKELVGIVDSSRFSGGEVDAVSSATPPESRYAQRLQAGYAGKNITLKGGFGFAGESDYSSLSPSIGLEWDFNRENTTLGVDVVMFLDDFRPGGGFVELGGEKDIYSISLGLTQSLTPLTLVQVRGTYSYSEGYLGQPYKPTVAVDGTILNESLPDEKAGLSLSCQIIQGYLLGRHLGSVNLSAAQYGDDWGLNATTVDLNLSQYITMESRIRLRIRGYYQTGAEYAKDLYSGNELYHSADIRLHPFASLLAGMKFTSVFPDTWRKSWYLPDRWDISCDFLVRDTKGDDKSANSRRFYQLYGPDEYYRQGTVMGGVRFDL